MRRRQREPEAVEVPLRLADPTVEDYVGPHEVRSLDGAQELAADRHSDAWDDWYAAQPTTTTSVPVVLDRVDLGTEQVDALVEMTGTSLVGLTVAQARRILLGEPFPFRDRESFERGLP